MSPYGKIYLSRVQFHPTWWRPFTVWREWSSGLREILNMPGGHGLRIARHMDALQAELIKPDDVGFWAKPKEQTRPPAYGEALRNGMSDAQ